MAAIWAFTTSRRCAPTPPSSSRHQAEGRPDHRYPASARRPDQEARRLRHLQAALARARRPTRPQRSARAAGDPPATARRPRPTAQGRIPGNASRSGQGGELLRRRDLQERRKVGFIVARFLMLRAARRASTRICFRMPIHTGASTASIADPRTTRRTCGPDLQLCAISQRILGLPITCCSNDCDAFEIRRRHRLPGGWPAVPHS